MTVIVMNEKLKNYLTSFNVLSEEEITFVANKVTPTILKKGDYFIRENEISKEVAFISSGIFRSFYTTSADEEVTYCFRFENSFVTAYSSFLTQTKSIENVQAITDTEIFKISRDLILKLEKSSPNWVKLLKMLAEQEYLYLEKRVFLLQKESAEKRYKDLLINTPNYLQQIPLNYLASYLGITQRHLSRIRKSIAN